MVASSVGRILGEALRDVAFTVEDALPVLLTGVIFLALAGFVILIVTVLVRATVGRVFPGEHVYVGFAVLVTRLVLWFGTALTFFAVVGLEELAAALGTASGFLALGISYALSGMIADAVAGVYLLRDPDFNPGDRVQVGETDGVVRRIELRKTRLDVDGDRVVRGNADVEKRWTKLGTATDQSDG